MNIRQRGRFFQRGRKHDVQGMPGEKMSTMQESRTSEDQKTGVDAFIARHETLRMRALSGHFLLYFRDLLNYNKIRARWDSIPHDR
jgi:hypothetical protein